MGGGGAAGLVHRLTQTGRQTSPSFHLSLVGPTLHHHRPAAPGTPSRGIFIRARRAASPSIRKAPTAIKLARSYDKKPASGEITRIKVIHGAEEVDFAGREQQRRADGAAEV